MLEPLLIPLRTGTVSFNEKVPLFFALLQQKFANRSNIFFSKNPQNHNLGKLRSEVARRFMQTERRKQEQREF